MARASDNDNDTLAAKKAVDQPAEGEVKVDKYEERTYWDALSDEHREVLKAAGQLPPKPDRG